ncbi:MAG: complex I NDUFA9 subunit family protein [Proteobacteria bacterium]|nr:complex I NDUFA9 subunit family protein [Pseudomonadota bacterium]
MAADPKPGCVAVFGGSGFLGRAIVESLVAEGITVRVAVRSPGNAKIPEPPGPAGKIEAIYADVRDETSVACAINGCDAVINAVGLYVERGTETFEAVHERGALNVAHQCAAQDIRRLIHISGIGADLNSESSYVRARARGELLVRDVFSRATIFCPSVLFGPDDKFLNTLIKIIRRSPVFPLFGTGGTKLQAVYVGDVAQATLRALRKPASRGKTYELGGPRAYTYRELIELILSRINKRRRLLLPLPFFAWDFLAAMASVLPAPPLTRDQVTLMKSDNVVAENSLTFKDLGVKATALEKILPEYSF